MGKRHLVIITVIISVLSIFIRGYSFGLGDQAIHLPLIYRTANPTLYQTDYLFTVNQASLSLFYNLIGFAINVLDNNVWLVFFIGFLLFTIIYFLMVSLLTRKLFGNNLSWFFSLFFFIYPYFIGGSAILSVETSLVPRLIGNMLSVLIIYLMLNNKYYTAFIILSIEFLIHPLSALLIGIIAFFWIVTNNEKNRVRVLLTGAVIYLLITGLFLVKNLPLLFNSSLNINNNEWLAILRMRNPYAFPTLWTGKGWLSLLIGIFPLLLYLSLNKYITKQLKNSFRFMQILLLISILTLIFQIIFTQIIPLPYIINLQLGRIWLLPITLSFMTLGYFSECMRVRFKINKNTVITIGLVILIYFAVVSYPHYIKQQDQFWIDSQIWINQHANINCLILVPFESQGFRVFSKRGITGEYKDGTLSFYSESFARNWNQRRLDLSNWEKTSNDNLEKLQNKYHFSYMVTGYQQKLNLIPVYQNIKYSIYQMPHIEKNCQ